MKPGSLFLIEDARKLKYNRDVWNTAEQYGLIYFIYSIIDVKNMIDVIDEIDVVDIIDVVDVIYVVKAVGLIDVAEQKNY